MVEPKAKNGSVFASVEVCTNAEWLAQALGTFGISSPAKPDLEKCRKKLAELDIKYIEIRHGGRLVGPVF